MSGWSCSNCGEPLEVTGKPPTSPRRPCPNCGSTARTANVSVTETLSAAVYLKTHSKHREGGRKVIREEIAGDDYHRKTGKWNIMHRLIDRMNNWYEETFYDRNSGEVIHKKAEPLTEHRHPRKPD